MWFTASLLRLGEGGRERGGLFFIREWRELSGVLGRQWGKLPLTEFGVEGGTHLPRSRRLLLRGQGRAWPLTGSDGGVSAGMDRRRKLVLSGLVLWQGLLLRWQRCGRPVSQAHRPFGDASRGCGGVGL